MLTYIYLNVDECSLTSSMPQQRCITLNSNFFSIMLILNKIHFLEVFAIDGHISFNLVRVHITLLLTYSINNDTHSAVYA